MLMIIAVIILIAAGGFLVFGRGEGKGAALPGAAPATALSGQNAVGSSSSALSPFGENAGTYADSDLGFSFQYPPSWTAEASGASSARLVTVALPAKNQSFQVYVTPIDDPSITAITVAEIRRDLPNLDIRSPENIAVGSNGEGKGVSFLSTLSGVKGDVRQVWFAANHEFFQFTSSVSSDDTLTTVLKTFTIGR